MARSRKSGGTSAANGDGQVDLDLLSAEPSVTTESVTRGPSRRRPWVIGGIGALLAVWLAVALVSISTGGGASEATAEDSADTPTTITAPDPDGQGAASVSSTPDRATTTTGSDDETTTTTTNVKIIETAPIDPDSQFQIAVLDGGRLRLLDLSTGVIEEYRYRADGMVIADNHLVLFTHRQNAAELTIVHLDDLATYSGTTPPESDLTASWAMVVSADEPDHVWVVAGEEDSRMPMPTQFHRIDLGSSSVVETRSIPGADSRSPWTLGVVGTVDLLSSFAGGVYEYDGEGGYELAISGHLLASDDNSALVESCDERFRCRRQWYDRASWQPIERALPPNGAYLLGVHAERWAIIVPNEFNNWGPQVFDLETGELLDAELGYGTVDAGATPISPDGRWLVHLTSGASGGSAGLSLTDLVTKETIDLPPELGGSEAATTAIIERR